MMDRDDVDLVPCHESVDNSVGSQDDLSEIRPTELGNPTSRFGEVRETLGGADDATDHHGREVHRVPGDERLDRGKVGACSTGPAYRPHERSCFLTSS